MHISGYIPVDLYSFIQFLFTILIILFGLLHLVKNTAKKYFFVDATFDEEVVEEEEDKQHNHTQDTIMITTAEKSFCASCGTHATKSCSGCKAVRYCSPICQSKHWGSGHKYQCKDLKQRKLKSSIFSQKGRAFGSGNTSSAVLQRTKKVLFPYEEFVKLFNWDKQGSPPCGLLNCGNSCFANVVLQCLSCTRPLVAYLLEKGHREQCRRYDWCFMCELQVHVERAVESSYPFSPINILSRLPNIGGNLGYGKQEDAHEFMRFAIDTMQSVCLDEFGGEKALHSSSLETTLIQHIFGGQLQSQVTCTECNKISNRNENMMDLTVEIQGEASSLEDCLDQFTVKERLDGENLYKCDGCDDYVKAWKRLSVCQAPNILTIALKRFQSGRFGKLNKRVTFPEMLDLGPYMSEAGNGSNLYHLYAVVVHVDMLNASFFGHYICYTKDFDGNWYRIDDCKVLRVELEEVLSQGAYMLLYSRNDARSDCVKPLKPSMEEQQAVDVAKEVQGCSEKPVGSSAIAETIDLLETSTRKSFGIICKPEEDLKLSMEEDQQRVYVTKEVQECSGKPLESCSIGESILFETSTSQSCNTKWQPEEDIEPSIEDDQQAVYAVKEVQECSDDTVVSCGTTESIDLFETSTSKSFAILCQPGDSASTVDPANDMNLDVDCVKADLRDPINSQQDINLSSTESNDCRSFQTAETLSASFSNVFVPTEQFPETNSEAGCNFREGTTSMNGCSIEEVTSSQCSVGGSLSGENGLLHIKDASYAVPITEYTTTGETLDVDDPASCPRYQNTNLENSGKSPSISVPVSSKKIEVKVLEPAGDKNPCGVKRKPLFARGFLDKNNSCRSQNGKGKTKMGCSEVGLSCKVKSYSNGFAKTPDIIYQNGTIECSNPNGSNCDPLKSSFVEETPKKMVPGIVANGGCNGESYHTTDLMDSKAPPVSATSDMTSSLTEYQNMECEVSSSKSDMQCDFGDRNRTSAVVRNIC
ncbi:hypothetical protein MKX01_001236 [Papaver californicum]|nr:hypothetical protein MKX01_001236 [Papaver californicum]